LIAPQPVSSQDKLSGAATPDATPHQLAVNESFRYDASLADVFFADPQTGWAVGGRGVIWHTKDAGHSWNQQSSGVTCPLNSVFFADAQHGWAAGGECDSYTNVSRGALLRTTDGGNTWTPVPNLNFTELTRLKFFDGSRGIALGRATASQPSGAFVTKDGGKSWQSMSADRGGGWLTGDFPDPQFGAVAGAAGRFATLSRGKIISPSHGIPSLRAYRAMRLLPPAGGWVVGDGGLVLTTKDLGHSWQSPPGELPDFAGELFDFHAIAALGQNVWIAGAPGTRIFRSPDGGKTWSTVSTGQQAPIRAMTFIDADHGWAVGDLGTILTTSDGGRSWTIQRAGTARAALLGIFANSADVPLEVLAAYGAGEGYVASVQILHTHAVDSENAANNDATDRARQALLLAGAATADTAWRFPLPPDELKHSPADLLAGLNRETDGRALERIEQHLVRAIRTWRPDVIVTHHTNLDAAEPRSAILAALLIHSVEAAADPARHQRLASEAGLAPWQVKKVYGLLPPNKKGTESLAVDRFSPWLGCTLSNFVAPSRNLLASPTPASKNWEFELLASTVKHTPGSRDFLHGITPSVGSDARRPLPDLPTNDLAQLKQLADRRRHLEALLKHTEGNAAWVAHVGQITEGLSPNDAAELLAQLADGYRAVGRLDLAADTFYLLSRRYPEHPLAARSLEWLIQFYSSSEAAHRLASQTQRNVRQSDLELTGSANPTAPGSAGGNLPVQQTSATLPIDSSPTVALSSDDRLHRATQLAEYLRASRPEIYAEPRVRFAEVAALRGRGFANPAKRYFLTLRQFPESNEWRRCGETELWLATPAQLPPPKPLGHCHAAGERPQLDAQLDEPLWKNADRLRLHSGDVAENRSTRDQAANNVTNDVRVAYDSDYLYIAIQCAKDSGIEYTNADGPRLRDADLTQHDRVTLEFDIDRDFTTAFELTVDSRGSTHDACWNDAHWNPSWYVAAGQDDKSWTIEAAVPMTEIVRTVPTARHVWAVSARRTIPRRGHQSWTGEPAADSPNHFGLLIFE
jgi:photosystem II stability/assembly factor-like uncharacterized protein